MKAIILAAGQGTRLLPLTEHRPKCMVEIAGKPFIELGWPVWAVPINGGWLEVDTLNDLRLDETMIKDGRMKELMQF